ncbi:CG5342 [Drosophila busckii]|uniref:GPI ethanolamine phosphate transferase 1 n=1 Tax=Drosophila busckii TaxID=30019 RepID=A0A0M4EIZ1_DROBS|nr:GPI ethanolamine phosphate transferase 1 [Drosophila busckii]ALC41155.1 CG5342 [Drosophila busckii]
MSICGMWILYAFLLHVLLLGSIFVIYFRSPVIKGLLPQARIDAHPPADRLVLIVTDGLRAESFFADNCNHVPHLREIFLREGLVGVSRTRVPTESRPGHIALIAGLYEDPSAVTRGWKANPIEFDTVFNRSDHTYAWGAHDVLHIFEKLADSGRPMHFDAYNHDLDFSGQHKTYNLDEWVFKKVRLLLQRKQEELRKAKHMVFFLHLLGLDTAGHVHKPGTRLFLENLNYTQQNIYEIFKKFEDVFPDGRTAYLLTSDHGMTDSGSHGAGTLYETDTPFMLWGSGVSRNVSSAKTFVANDAGAKLPLHELEQAQLTPLMSALIGLPPPMNNFGVLPYGYINTGKKYESLAAHSNALQLLAQYEKLREEHMRGIFAAYLKVYKPLDAVVVDEFKANFKELLEKKDYEQMLVNCANIMHLALDGIDYYHGYYRNALLLCTTATMLGWMFYLYRLLNQRATTKLIEYSSYVKRALLISIVLVICFIAAQRMALPIGLYLLLPLPVWLIALRRHPIKETEQSPHAAHNRFSLAQLLLIIICAELLVFTFFERRLISICFLAFALYTNWRNFKINTCQFYLWLAIVVALSCFPLLPPSVGYQNRYLFMAGIVVVLLRAFLTQNWRRYSWHTHVCNVLILVSAVACVQLHSQQLAIPLALKVLSWLYLVYSIVSIQLNKETSLELRLEQITYNLGVLYTLLCTSYESLFIQLLGWELSMSLKAQRSKTDMLQQSQAPNMQTSLRVAFTVLLYTFFSLFGSGNIASVSSFDPNIARCFLSHFAPFIILALVLLKLLLPVILNLSTVYAYCEYTRLQERHVFICLLLICDIMGLNFLFLVRNTGSWLEIGSSISHFVIMEVTTLVLLLLAYAAKMLLRLSNCQAVAAKLR